MKRFLRFFFKKSTTSTTKEQELPTAELPPPEKSVRTPVGELAEVEGREEKKPRISKLTRFNPLPTIFNLIFPKEEERRPTFRAEPLVTVVQGDVLIDPATGKPARYNVGQAAVTIAAEGEKGFYMISEPLLNPREHEIYSELMDYFFSSLKPLPKMGDPMKYIEQSIWGAAEDLGMLEEVERGIQKYIYYIAKDSFGFGKCSTPMNDPCIEEVSCTGYGKPVTVIHRGFSQFGWLETNIAFKNEEEVANFIQKLAQRAGISVSTAVPVGEGMTHVGDRFAVTFGSEVTRGSTFTIRRFMEESLTLAHLVKLGTISPLLGAYQWYIMEKKGFSMLTGPPAAGKTTELIALLLTISPNMKVVTIEEGGGEINLPHIGWLPLYTRKGYTPEETQYDYDLFKLALISLRHRPDYVCLGEVRGIEARALFQAGDVGSGVLCTFHADSPKAAFSRMRSYPISIPDETLKRIWYFAQMGMIRTPRGVKRRVTEILEVSSGEGKLKLNEIFSWNPRGDNFLPSSPHEVVRRSERIRTHAAVHRLSTSEVVRELRTRAEYLQAIIDEKKEGYREFSEAMRKYYRVSARAR